jgi:nucleotide-binding universal stress UspA family protein
MQKPTHIRVATDFSRSARPAVAAARLMGESFGAPITLMHVYDPTPLVPPAVIPNPERMETSIGQELEAAALKELERIRDEQLAGLADVKVEVVQHPSPHRAICDLARDRGANLIIVGTHGRTGIRHVLLGSVAERVVRHAHTSVLTVRPDTAEAKS